MNNHLIIMAGGIGSRFWPLSTPEMPKQFIDVLGVGKSLLQLTVERFEGIIPYENIWVVTSKRYRDIVKSQIPNIQDSHILLEPCMRNTAPCIAYASYKIKTFYPNANLVFSPADHLVIDLNEFKRVISESLRFTKSSDSIITLGMKPSRPETGYGYIKGIKSDNVIRKVETFREKPNIEKAKEYFADESFFWNSGLFIWNVNTIISEFEKYLPEMAFMFKKLSNVYYTKDEQSIIDEEFPKCRNISIDYAVMEQSGKTYVFPASFGWSDLGTWGSLYSQLKQDNNNNAIVGGNIKMVDCENCIVHTSLKSSVVVQGLNDYIIAKHGGKLLICQKEKEQLIKDWIK